MKRILLLLSFGVLAGCDIQDASTDGKASPTTTISTGHSSSVASRTTEAPSAFSSVDPEDLPKRPPEFEERKEVPPEEAPPIPDTYKPLNKEKTIFLEVPKEGPRHVHLLAKVCLREGPLEMFLCRLNTKEHESILHVDADPEQIHAALIAAGAKRGSPVVFHPEYKAASGSVIAVSVTYREKGKVKTAPSGTWVKDKRTGKDMAYNWVFAGSRYFKDPEGKMPDYYLARNGELISLANFPDSMLDLPVKSPKDVADLIFEINTDRIPPMQTPVIVTLTPVVEKKKK